MIRTVYLAALAVFILTPMLVIVVFSFDANRFPTLPGGGFSLQWHREAFADRYRQRPEELADRQFRHGDYRDSDRLCGGLLGLSLQVLWQARDDDGGLNSARRPGLDPGMAMLAALSRTPLFGTPFGIIACHAAIAASFAMALIRLRLGELGADMESAAVEPRRVPMGGLIHFIIPFCKPSLIAAFCLSAAVSFDEFMVAWFVGGVNETLPVRVLNMLLGQVNPKINAIGTLVLAVSLVLVTLAQRFAGIGAKKETA